MKTVLCLVGILAAAPAVAHADRYALGVSFAAADGDRMPDGHEGRGIWARARLSERLWVEGELARATSESGYSVRRAAATAVLDLSRDGRLTPFLLGTVAGERSANGQLGEDDFRALELGAGLALEVVDQLVIGIDARRGERARVASRGEAVIALWAPGLVEGTYGSARLTVGVSF